MVLSLFVGSVLRGAVDGDAGKAVPLRSTRLPSTLLPTAPGPSSRMPMSWRAFPQLALGTALSRTRFPLMELPLEGPTMTMPDSGPLSSIVFSWIEFSLELKVTMPSPRSHESELPTFSRTVSLVMTLREPPRTTTPASKLEIVPLVTVTALTLRRSIRPSAKASSRRVPLGRWSPKRNLLLLVNLYAGIYICSPHPFPVPVLAPPR